MRVGSGTPGPSPPPRHLCMTTSRPQKLRGCPSVWERGLEPPHVWLARGGTLDMQMLLTLRAPPAGWGPPRERTPHKEEATPHARDLRTVCNWTSPDEWNAHEQGRERPEGRVGQRCLWLVLLSRPPSASLPTAPPRPPGLSSDARAAGRAAPGTPPPTQHCRGTSRVAACSL